jgi:hypothetical protein
MWITAPERFGDSLLVIWCVTAATAGRSAVVAVDVGVGRRLQMSCGGSSVFGGGSSS